jgi:dCTP deaminase
MSVLADHQIESIIGMIEPLSEPVSGGGIISYGLTSYGYDARLGWDFMRPLMSQTPFDPRDKRAHEEYSPFRVLGNGPVVIEPNSYILGETIETFHIPRDIVAVCLGKSTYARAGVIINVTPLEPQWRGKVTIEIANLGRRPVCVWPGQGIMQVVFLRADAVCQVSYADKRGKYQNQAGVTPGIVV